MSNILDIGNVSGLRTAAAPHSVHASQPVEHRDAVDTFELSPLGKMQLEGQNASTLRAARVSAVRSEIHAGTYETPQRVDGAVDRLLDILG